MSSARRRHVKPSLVQAQVRSLTVGGSSREVQYILDDISSYTAGHRVLIFESQIHNPYLNLGLENYLLTRSDPTSRILLFYTNHPCVVIGRNQNPWLECNIRKLCDPRRQGFDLVRRRSGGGTVVHDVGNLNFSFIVPNDKDFRRDKHGQLVVNALNSTEVFDGHAASRLYQDVRINDRHDIVMSKGTNKQREEYKVSGSAYKLTKGRALHHGTILHSSPHVSNTEEEVNSSDNRRSTFSALLSSPARPFLEAKGVESVRSPVHNLFDADENEVRRTVQDSIIQAVSQQFRETYEAFGVMSYLIQESDVTHNARISRDVQELKTLDWQFCQTPSFKYRSPRDVGIRLEFEVKQGVIGNIHCDQAEFISEISRQLEGRKLHEITSWADALPQLSVSETATGQLLSHLQNVFPRVGQTISSPSEFSRKD